MTVLVDLFPNVIRREADALEAACEQIESTAGRPFSEPSLSKATSYYGAKHAIRSMLALGLIERISPPRARPVFYIVPERFAKPLRESGVAAHRSTSA